MYNYKGNTICADHLDALCTDGVGYVIVATLRRLASDLKRILRGHTKKNRG